MNRILSLLLVLVLVFGGLPLTFADNHMTAGEELKALGLVKGDTEGNLMEEKTFTRAELAVMLARLNNVEDQAVAYELSSPFSDDQDHWAKTYIAYAEEQGWMVGVGDNLFDPEGMVTGQMVATTMLRVLGYTPNWATALQEAAAKGIIDDNAGSSFRRANAFDMMYDAVKTKVKDQEITLGQKLGVLSMVVVAPVAIDSAVALNSKLIEVSLDEDTDAPEAVNASIFTVMDDAGQSLSIASATLAQWDTDNTTVLVRLSDETDPGDLYTISSGETEAAFGGKAVDSDEPTVVSVSSTDYNEVTVEFSEAVVLESIVISINERYGSKASLNVLDMSYNGKEKVVFTTQAQSAATLYSVKLSKTVDLAGNEMTKDESKTFVGQKKPTDAMRVTGASSEDYNQVIVKFDQKIDTVDATMFSILEKYGAKSVLEVLEAEVITDADDYANAVTADEYKAVLLTTNAQKDATLYEVKVSTIASIYDNTIDKDNATKTFTGQKMPTDKVEVSNVTVTSNTEIVVEFSAKLDQSTVEASDFTIKEKYGQKNPLTVLLVDQVDGKNITLVTGSQSAATLYELSVKDVKDIYGNILDTTKNIDTFAGKGVADAIESIVSITRGTNANTEIIVTFDQSLGSNGTNVSLYTIDNGVGYPEKAEKITGSPEKIQLTIPKTTEGKIYTLTVLKGLKNGDGIPSTENLTKTFAGRGSTTGLPKIEAAVVTDDQTLKVYFDRDITDSTIEGYLWSETGKTVTSEWSIKKENGTDAYGDLSTFLGTYTAYQSEADHNVLIIRSNTKVFESGANYTMFKLRANSTYVDDDYNEVLMAANNKDAVGPFIEAAQGLDKKTVLVYFASAVDLENTTVDSVNNLTKEDFMITGPNSYSEAPASLVKVANSQTTVKLVMSTDMTAGEYTLKVKDNSFKDITGQLSNKDNQTSDAVYADILKFAGSSKDASTEISDVQAVMNNARQVTVYFPVAMNNSTTANAGVLVASEYVVQGENSSGVSQGTVSPSYVAYDDVTNQATLYFASNVSISNATKYFLKIAEGKIDDVTGNRAVGDGKTTTNGVKVEVALSTKAPDTADFISYQLSEDKTEVTVEFDRPVAFTNNASVVWSNDSTITIDEFVNHNASPTFSTTDIASWFAVSGKDINDINLGINKAERISETKVKITLNIAAKAGSDFEIKTDLEATGDQIRSYTNTMMPDVNADEASISIAVPSSYTAVFDTVVPKLRSVQLLNTSGITATTAEVGDTLVFTFSEKIQPSTTAITGLTAGGSAVTGLNLNNFSSAMGIGSFVTPFSATDGGNATYESTMTASAMLNSQGNVLTLTITGYALGGDDTALVDASGNFTPVSTVTDLAGKALDTAVVVPSGSF